MHANEFAMSSRWLDKGEDGDGEVSSEQATGLRKKGASTEGLTANAAIVMECYFFTLVENRPFLSAPFSELLPAFCEPGSEGDLIPAIPSSRE